MEKTFDKEYANKFSDGLTDMLFGLLFAMCCLLSESKASGYFAMMLFCVYSLLFIRNRTLLFLKYLSIILFIDMSIIGCFAIEYSNFYLYELGVYSSFVGSLPLLIFSRWLLIPILSILDRLFFVRISNYHSVSPKVSSWIDASCMVFLVLVLLCFSQVVQRPAFLLGIDRFEYANSITSPGLITIISGYLNELSIIPILSLRHGDKRLGFASLLAYVLYLFWVGTQFGLYFTLASMLILAYFDKLQFFSITAIRRVAYISITVIATMIIIAVGIRSMTSSSSLQSFDYLLQRTSQQGQLWWRTYDMGKNDVASHQGFSQELEQQIGASTSVADNVGSTFGIYGVMYRTAPADRVSLQLSKGSAYAEAGYAAAYYYFGPIGSLGFSLVIGILVNLVTNSFLLALVRGRIIEAIIHSRLMVLVRGFMGTFVFTGLISPISIASYLYLFSISLTRMNRGTDREQRVDDSFFIEIH